MPDRGAVVGRGGRGGGPPEQFGAGVELQGAYRLLGSNGPGDEQGQAGDVTAAGGGFDDGHGRGRARLQARTSSAKLRSELSTPV